MIDKRQQRKEIKNDVKGMQEKKEAQKKQLAEDFKTVAATVEGANVLKFIFKESGYDVTNQVVNIVSRTLDTNCMIANEGRRSLWITVRGYLSRNLKSKIEL